MPIKFSCDFDTTGSFNIVYSSKNKIGSILTTLRCKYDSFIRYIQTLIEIPALLLFDKDTALEYETDASNLASIEQKFADLDRNFNILINTLTEFSCSLKTFIENPSLYTAINLKKSYKLYNQNITKLSAHSYENDNVFTNYIELLKGYINLSILPNDILKFFQKDLDELIKKYKNLGSFATISFEQWYENIILLVNNRFRTLLLKTDYANNLVGYLCQSNNPIIGKGLCAGIALYGVYQSLTTGDIQVEGDLLVSNNKISSVETCQFFNKQHGIVLMETKLTGKTPKQASKLIAEKLKSILINIINSREEQYGFELYMRRNNKAASGHAFGISKTKEHLFFIDANYGVFKFNIDELEKFCNFISWFLYTTKYCYYFNKFGISSMASIEHEFPTSWELQRDAIHNLLKSVPASSKNIPKFNKALRFTKNCISKANNQIRDLLNSSHTVASTLFDCCYNRIR
jgi:hypothetical protein